MRDTVNGGKVLIPYTVEIKVEMKLTQIVFRQHEHIIQ